MASSSEETRLLELFQLQNDQGPCLESFHEAQPVHSPDLEEGVRPLADLRPRGRPRRIPCRARAADAVRADTIGALNLFHANPAGCIPADARIGQALVDVATIGLIQVDSVVVDRCC